MSAALLLALIPVSVAFFCFYYVIAGSATDSPGEAGVALAATALFVVALALVRSPWFRIGAWLIVLVPWVGITLAWQSEVPGAPDHDILYYTLIPVLLSGLLLDLRMAIAFAVVNLLGIGSLLVGQPATGVVMPLSELQDVLFFMVTATPLILVGAGILERSAREKEAANDLLREADAYRLQLLSMIAHDLASPLSPVQIQLGLMERESGRTKALDMVRRNVDHLQRLIGDVRDLARVEAGRIALEPRPIDLSALAHKAVEAFAADARERGVSSEVDAPGELPVHADPDRVNQVLINLITNALKFTPNGGNVKVSVSRHDHVARVSVTDEGRGLAADEIPRLFKPFSQVHERHEVKEKGTGLGLFICKGLIEKHHGKIWVESEGHGKGSTFAFSIPLKD